MRIAETTRFIELLKFYWGTSSEVILPNLDSELDAAQWLLQKLLRRSESVLVPIYGEACERLALICERLGSDVLAVEQERGLVFEQAALIAELRRRKPSLLILAHGDHSTGQMQPIDQLGKVCRELDILFLVDVSATAGETIIRADDWHIDGVLTGPEGMGLPESLQPMAFNEQIRARLRGDKLGRMDDDCVWQSASFQPILNAAVSQLESVSGPREAIERHFKKRQLYAEALGNGIEAMGLSLFGRQPSRLPAMVTVEVPEGIDSAALRSRIRRAHAITIGGQPPSMCKPTWQFHAPDRSDGMMDELLHTIRSLADSLQAEGHVCREDDAIEAVSCYFDQLT